MSAAGVIEAALWLSLGAIAYAYFAYPWLVMALARFAAPRVPAAQPTDWPSVDVLVAAYNEEVHIEERLRNLLAQDYPADRLTVLVGSDGSVDATVAIASRFEGARVRVFAYPLNRGKASVLNDLAAAAGADILVFTDANTEFRPDAVRRLVTAIASGAQAACGELLIRAAGTDRGNADASYWSIERRLKRAEGRIGGLLGANGGIYAMRREQYRPLGPDMICDDFVLAMDIAAHGGRLDYVPEALAYEEAPGDLKSELGRRIRIGIGNYQAFFRRPRYLLGAPWPLPWTYLSHKVLRWFAPHLLLVVFAASWALAGRTPYLLFALAQTVGYAFVALAYASGARLPGPLRLAVLVVVLNAAFVVAFSRYALGRYRGSWARTERRAA